MIREISKSAINISIAIGLFMIAVTIFNCGGTTDFNKLPYKVDLEKEETQKTNRIIESQYAEEAQEAIAAILPAAKIHHLETGQWVADIKELPKLRLDRMTVERWNFVITSGPNMILSVQATSTGLMPGGAGKIVRYDTVNRSWSGYGIE
jgi:hypothetical protein